MTFLHAGLFAVGAACVALPIIIHLLFRRRRKPIQWGAMRFLVEAIRRQRRRLRLEQLLLLAARCLLVLLLAAAIARPVLEAAGVLGGGGGRRVLLLIDDSIAASVRTAGEDATALDRHKAEAGRILSALGPTDRAGLITLSAPSEGLVVPASGDLGGVRTLIDGLEPTDARADLHGAFDRVREALSSDDDSGASETVVVVLSDLLAGSADILRPLPTIARSGDAARLRVLATPPAERAAGNTQIQSVEPLRPVVVAGGGGFADDQVRVSLRRTGESVGREETTSVRISVTGASAHSGVAGGGVVRWAPGEAETTTTLALDAPLDPETLGEAAALVVEIDQDPIARDNIHRRPIGVREELRVGLIDRRRFGSGVRVERMSAGDWLRLALRPGDAAPVEVVDLSPGSLDAASLAALDAAFLPRPDLVDAEGWSRLARFVEGGGLLVVTPPPEVSVHLWTDAMAEALGLDWAAAREPVSSSPPLRLAEEQGGSTVLGLLSPELAALSRAVSVSRRLPIERTGPEARALLTLENGEPLVVASTFGARTEEAVEAEGEPVRARPARGGLVVLFTTAPTLEWTDLPAKPLMVPLVQEIVRQGVGEGLALGAQTAGARVQGPPRTADLLPLGGAPDRTAVAVDDDGRTTSAVRTAGLYRAVDERGALRGLVAVNADADGARTDVQPRGALESWLEGAAGGAESMTWLEGDLTPGAALARASTGSSISVPLLLAALVVACLEALMARWFSHATVKAGGGGARAGDLLDEALEAAA